MSDGPEDAECLDDDTIALFLDGRLDDARRSNARAHIDVCESCRRLLADAAISSSDAGDVVPAAPPVLVAPGYVVAGRYEILRTIGRGGSGSVVAARHVGLDTHVAIKVLHPELLAETATVRRFLREARLASRLKSEHVVRIHDVDELASGQPYLVMELLEGEDLHALQARRALGVDEAVGYVLQAAKALVEAHAVGLIHRDIKPQNLFLARSANNDGSCVKVLDFGLAKDLSNVRDPSASLTTDGMILGSPEYMSPEQVRSSKDVDVRTDVWALGATLFRLLAGRPPFESPTLPGLLASILADEAPSVRQYRPEVSVAIERAIARALDKSLASRLPDIGALAAALRVDATSTAVGLDRTVELGTAPTAPAATTVQRGEATGVGRFRLLGTLGSGGMGDVHRAYDSLLDRPVALKVLRGARGADNSQRRRRLIREARAAAALTHPNTVTIFDVGEDADGVFIAMELLEGEDLRAVIARGDSSIENRLRWLRESASALAAAHERGFVHRDVKPANMFVCADGTLKLLDFGIAKREGDSPVEETAPESLGPSSMQTGEGHTVGTPRYMAPEQRAGEGTDARSDQYSWGLVAVELLTPTGQRADLPEPIAATVMRALETNKERRFPSMRSVVDVLDGLTPPSETRAEPSHRPPARVGWRPIAIAIAIAAGAAGIAGLATVKSRRAVVPACTVASLRHVDLGTDDRIGLDATGAVIVVRDFRTPLRLEREDGAGWTPVAYPAGAFSGQWPLENLALAGTRYLNRAAIAFVLEQGRAQGAMMVVIEPEGSSGSMRIFGPLTGISLTSFGDSPVAIATTEAGAPRRNGQPGAVEAHRLRPVDRKVIATGGGADPSTAAVEDKLAVAWATDRGIRFLLLDRELEPIGEALDVTSVPAAPSVVFDGQRASVFWIEGKGQARRLMTSSLAMGDRAFGAPRVAIDGAVAESRPVAVALAGSRWGLAWVALSGASSVLRFSRIDAAGRLSATIDVASAPTIDAIRGSLGARDASRLVWREGPAVARVATVTCPVPPVR